MSKDWSIRKRRPVRRKQIAPLLKALEESLGIDLSVDGAFLEMAEYGPWQMVFVDKVPKAIEVKNSDNERFAFWTPWAFPEQHDGASGVAVDAGAVPFLWNGAD